MKNTHKFGLLASSSLLAVACVMTLTQEARADCTGDITSVVCTGIDSDGYDGSANINQTITVSPDASVENVGDGIILGEGGKLTIDQGINGVTADGRILIAPTLGAAAVALFGDNATLTNNGLLKVDTTNLADPELASGIDILGTGADITNNGTIEILFSGGPDNRGGIGISSLLGYATVDNTGDIVIDNASGALAEGINVLSDTSVTNSGTITITGGPGVDGSMVDPFDPFGPPIIIPAAASTRGMTVWGVEGVNTTLVSNSGQITVSGNTPTPYAVVGVQIDDAGDFDNSGTITVSNTDGTSDSTGLLMALDTPTGSITNSGTITAMNAIVVTPANLTFADVTLLNSGALEGHVDLGGGNNSITNTSTGIIGAVNGSDAVTLAGNLTTGAGNDTLDNAGRITGNVDLGDGTNIVNNTTGARIDGSLSMGAGADVLTNAGTIIGDVNFGSGDDKVIIQDGAIFSGILNGGAHTTGDIIELQGSATLVGVTYTGFEIIGGNCENVDVDGYTSDTDFNLGANCDLTNRGSFDAPNILGGDGDNTLTNSGTISADINLGGGNDRFVMIHGDSNPSSQAYLNNNAQQSTIEGGTGTDILELQGTGALGGFLFSTGPVPTGFELLEVKGSWTIYTDMSFSAGTKLIGDDSALTVFAGTLTSTVTGDDFANTLYNAGTITGAVDLGAGDDTLKLYGTDLFSGSFGSTVTGGAGIDTLDLQGANTTTPNVYDGGFSSFEKLTLTGTDSEASVWTLTGPQAYTSGVFLSGADTHLNNQGALSAELTGDDNNNSVTNAGTITGNVDFGAGTDTLDNTGGIITGNVDFGAGDDMLHGDKFGTISGTVTLGTGDDTFIVTGTSLGTVASVDASTQVADGTDTLLMSGDINSILAINAVAGFEKATVESAIWTLLGDQTFTGGVSLNNTGSIANWGGLTADVTGDANINLLTNASTGTITGDVTLNDGDDGVWNLGTISGTLDLGNDDDWLTNSGVITGDILFGDGIDVLDNTGGTITGNVDFGAGDDVLDTAKMGSVTGRFFMGAGNDTVNNTGSVVMDLEFGDGVDVLNNTGGTITGNVDFGAGNDVVDTADLGTISGTITLGAGNDNLTNSITYAHDIDLGSGDDTFTNTGTFEQNVYFGDGADTLDNTSGIINGNVFFGNGNDLLDITKLGQIAGSIDLGAGDDTLLIEIENANFQGSIFNLFQLSGGEGNDTIQLAGYGTFEGSLDSDMENLGLSGGTWILKGQQTYQNVRLIDTGKLVNESVLSAGILGDDNANVLTNNLTITGNIDFGNGVDILNNTSGTITGNVDFGGGDEVVEYSTLGEVSGDISLGGGADTFVWNGSELNIGSLSGGADTDILQLTQSGSLAADAFSDFEKLDVRGSQWTLNGTQTYTAGVVLGSGSHMINDGTLNADVTGGAHNDLLTNSGTLNGDLTFDSGNDSLDNKGGTINGSVAFDDGSDTLDNTGGTITGDVDFGAGNDTIAAARLGAISGTISLGTGDDRLQITSASYALGKTVEASADLADGTDTLELQGSGSLAQGDYVGYEILNVNGTNVDADWSLTGEHVYGGGVYMTATSRVSIENNIVANFYGDGGANEVANQGTIFTTAAGMDLGAGNDTLTNSGNISGFFVVATFSTGDGDDTIDNSGTLTGTVELGSGSDNLTNTGTLTGNILFGAGTDRLTNNKTITGDVDLGSGTDNLTNTGILTGNINLGHDDDSFTNSADVTGNITSASAEVYIGGETQFGGLSSSYAHQGQSDADTIVNSGTIRGMVSLGGGDDMLTVEEGGTIDGEVKLGDATTTRTFGTGDEDPVFKATDVDNLTNKGTIIGAVSLGAYGHNYDVHTGKFIVEGKDSDTLVNSGNIHGNIQLGNGGHTLTGSNSGVISFGEDNDELTNNGTIHGSVFLGNGNNNIAVDSGANVRMGADNDTLINNGTINGNVFLDNGNNNISVSSGGTVSGNTDDDILTNNGAINGTVTFGGGNDTLIWGAGAVFGGIADGGGGTDTLKTQNAANTTVTINFDKLSNFENLETEGDGKVTFAGNVKLDNIAVTKGALAVNSLVEADVTVADGAKLQGRSLIRGNVTVQSGRVAPGNSIDTLTIDGNYTQESAGTYELEIWGSDNDLLIVTGAANISGTLEVFSDFVRGDNELGDTFEFLTATGGITGTFDVVNGDTPYFMTFTPLYHGNSFEVRLDRDSFILPEMSAQNQVVGAQLDALAALADSAGGSTELVNFVEDMTWTLRSEATPAFNQLLNQTSVRLATPTLRARQAFMGQVMDNALGMMGRKDHDGRWAISGNLYGEWGDVDTDGNAMGYSYNASGAMTSFDYQSARTRFGFALGGSRLNTGSNDNGRTSLDTAAYMAHQTTNGVELGASLGFSLDYYETSRSLQTTSQNSLIKASPNGHSVMANMHIRKHYTMGELSVQTLADLQFSQLNRDAFAEDGGGDLGLAFESNKVTSLKSALGVRLSRQDDEKNIRFVPMLGLFWDHEFGDLDRSAVAAFQALPEDGFDIYGVNLPKDQFRIEAGFLTHLSDRVTLGVTYSGTFSSNLDVNRAQANIRYVW